MHNYKMIMVELENMQKRAIETIKRLKQLPYEEKLKCLGIFIKTISKEEHVYIFTWKR